MSEAFHTGKTAAQLNQVLQHVPEHLHPIIEAIRDCGIGLLSVGQDAGPFRRPKEPKRGAIYLLGDDLYASKGPEAFHPPSARRAIRECVGFAVIAGAPPTQMYAAAAAVATTGRHVMIIETQPEHEIQWVELIQKLAPGRPLMWSTVKGGSA